MAIFQTYWQKNTRFCGTVYLLLLVLLKTLGIRHFTAGAQIMAKLEQHVAVGDFQLKVK